MYTKRQVKILESWTVGEVLEPAAAEVVVAPNMECVAFMMDRASK